jgi:hypothetical protein
MGIPERLGQWRRDHHADLGALAVILIFFLLFFWRVFLRGDLPLIGDPMGYSHPLRSVAWEMIRSGSLPLWTPYIFSGYPLLSMAQLGLGYPVTWVYLFLPAHWAETVYVIAPFLLAPAFVYAYVRVLGRSRLAALIAGLSFTYGGMMASKLSNGMLPNAVMWLPLMLISIEQARTGRFLPSLVGATGAYAMSILTGIGQGFLLVGMIAGAYSLFVAAYDFRRLRWRVWKPVGVAVGSLVLATGVAAFQIFETWTALRLSIRSELTYDIFGQLSLPPWRAWGALWIPLYYHIESAPFLAPAVLALAVAGVIAAVKRPAAHHQAFFWLAMTLVASLLILGTYTPFYRLVYHLPILNKFRGPSRHSFEWTFALSILAAYGWDLLAAVRLRLADPRRRNLLVASAVVCVLLGAVATVFWRRGIKSFVPLDSEIELAQAAKNYLVWKIAFVIFTAGALWSAWRLSYSRGRTLLIIGCLAGIFFVEAYFFMAFAWMYPPAPTEWFTRVRPPKEFLKHRLTPQERVYLRVVGFSLKDLEPSTLDFLNLAAPDKVQNIAGYEPLILRRYSHALGDVWLDGVRKLVDRPLDDMQRAPDFELFDPRSHVLDLLNTSIVAGYTNLDVNLPALTKKGGIPFAFAEYLPPDPREPRFLTAPRAEGDILAVVSTLAFSGAVEQGKPVGKLLVHTTDGRLIERQLLAGQDTAEWAHSRPDVMRNARHRIAPVFASTPGDEQNSFPAHTYWTRLPLGARVSVDRIEIVPPASPVVLRLWKATLYDSASGRGTPLLFATAKEYEQYLWLRDPARWQPIYANGDVVMLDNKRALPRAWLVGEAEAVDEEEALRRISGTSERKFEPRRTALLEVPAAELPSLPGGMLNGSAEARVVSYEPNRLVIETKCESAALLVISEINYPGWVATIDGAPVKIYPTNYILRGVATPAGTHRVEMRYTAPGALRGAMVSAGTLSALVAMIVWSRRRRGRTG